MKLKPGAPADPVLLSRYISPETRARIAADAVAYLGSLQRGRGKTKLSNAALLEQYYTNDSIVRALWSILSQHVALSEYLILDPCAGNAVFSRNSEHSVISLDVDPKHDAVIKANFFAITVQDPATTAVVGNPPFSLAVEFFNHAAKMADVIAMILPASFSKDAMQKRLNELFHCVYQVRLPSHSFVHNGRSSDIPAVFQVWIKKKKPRLAPRRKPRTHPDFVLDAQVSAHFAIRRIGARAGEIHLPDERRGTSYFHVAVTSPARAKEVEGIFRGLSLANVAKSNGRYGSINKEEIVTLYSAALLRRVSCQVGYEHQLSGTTCRYRPGFGRLQRRLAPRPFRSRLRRPEASSRFCTSCSQHSSGHCPATMSETR
jgi:predicted RNA methylase